MNFKFSDDFIESRVKSVKHNRNQTKSIRKVCELILADEFDEARKEVNYINNIWFRNKLFELVNSYDAVWGETFFTYMGCISIIGALSSAYFILDIKAPKADPAIIFFMGGSVVITFAYVAYLLFNKADDVSQIKSFTQKIIWFLDNYECI